MYNEQLEQLIEAALKDGMMSGKERQVLFNEAQSLGINLLEFENELNRRILSRKNESVSDSPNGSNNNSVFTRVEQPEQNEESKGIREKEREEKKEVKETKDKIEENEDEIKERDEEDEEDTEDEKDTEDYNEDEDDQDSLVGDILNDFKDAVSDIKSEASDILHDIIGNPKHTIKSSAASQKKSQKTTSKINKTPLTSNSSNRSNFAQLLNSGNLSSKKLNEVLDDIVDGEYMTSADCEDMDDFRELKAQKKRIKEALVQFPTPSDKDDLLDFMLYLKPKIQHSEHSDAFLMKYNECLEKVEILYPEDPDFEKIIGSKVKKNNWGKFRGNMKKTGMVMGGIGRVVWVILKIAGILLIIAIVLFIVLMILGSLS